MDATSHSAATALPQPSSLVLVDEHRAMGLWRPLLADDAVELAGRHEISIDI